MSLNTFCFGSSHFREFTKTASLFPKKSDLLISTYIQKNGTYKVELEQRLNLNENVVNEFIQYITDNTSFDIN